MMVNACLIIVGSFLEINVKSRSAEICSAKRTSSRKTQSSYYANDLQNAEAEEAYEVINEIRVSCSNQLKIGLKNSVGLLAKNCLPAKIFELSAIRRRKRKREVDAEKQKSILQRIVSICDFEDLKAFTLDTYQEKHIEVNA
ncbi:unnamed protein product [Clavelina lepadiformis]|uniref:Uncharacterized protein n=1 Tax=Clavelina lepadiformis TaxID=159417 RepID=A0ABP0G2R1_CLALP